MKSLKKELGARELTMIIFVTFFSLFVINLFFSTPIPLIVFLSLFVLFVIFVVGIFRFLFTRKKDYFLVSTFSFLMIFVFQVATNNIDKWRSMVVAKRVVEMGIDDIEKNIEDFRSESGFFPDNIDDFYVEGGGLSKKECFLRFCAKLSYHRYSDPEEYSLTYVFPERYGFAFSGCNMNYIVSKKSLQRGDDRTIDGKWNLLIGQTCM